MATKLDQLLESLAPQRVYEETQARMNDAINEFMRSQPGNVDSWESFKSLMTNFLRFMENRVLRLKGNFTGSPEMDWGRACKLMMQEFGPNGEKTSYDRVRTGINGGLGGVLRAVGERMAGEYTQNEIDARVSFYIRSLSTDEQLAAAKEYLAKFGHLLPPEMAEGSGVRVLAFFPLFLKQHPRVMLEMRRVGR